MQIFSSELADLLKPYVRKDQPFGPPDAADIVEPACAAALFDWNNSAFAELLSGSDVLVGRRGSGKSALLSTFRSKRYLNRELTGDQARLYRDRYKLTAKALNAVPDLTVDADTASHVDILEQYCRKQTSPPPVEIMARLWRYRIWLIVGSTLQRTHPLLWETFPISVREYVRHEDVLKGILTGSTESIPSSEEYIKEMEAALLRAEKRCVVTFDNLERYKFDETQNAVLGGLIAAAGKMIGVQHASLDVKLCLPAEVFEHIKAVIFRADKDLQKLQFLHWNSTDLMHLAASRLRVFLQLHDPDSFEIIKDLRLNERGNLQSFWRRYLPSRIVNSVGLEEESFTYLLRHTQLLPRHLLTALNAIARRSVQQGSQLFRGPFQVTDIIRGIEDTEDSNTQAILSMYEPMFPRVREIFDLVMPRFRTVFDYGFLQKVYNSSAKSSMVSMQKGDFRHFWRLMLSTGALGVVDQNYSSTLYVSGRFEFNSKYALKISDKDLLCVHPMFSRVYNVKRDPDNKIVLPRGSDFGEDAL